MCTACGDTGVVERKSAPLGGVVVTFLERCTCQPTIFTEAEKPKHSPTALAWAKRVGN